MDGKNSYLTLPITIAGPIMTFAALNSWKQVAFSNQYEKNSLNLLSLLMDIVTRNFFILSCLLLSASYS